MSAEMSTIRAGKTLLRKQIKERIAKLSAADKKRQSDFVYMQLINLPSFKTSQRISVYLSTNDEVATDSLVKKCFELNKDIFVPRYKGDVMQMVKLNSVEDWESLPLTKWNIRQPDESIERDDALQTGGLDLVITPGVAFTKDGWRMGHGKGYYDSYFHQLLDSPEGVQRPTIVGVCFREQLVDELPRHDHDVQLDRVLFTEH